MIAGFATPARAETLGQPYDWQTGFQTAASPVMAQISDFHNLMLVIIYCDYPVCSRSADLRHGAVSRLSQPQADENSP